MDFTLTTPALLFPAISLLLLAYTNRFLTLANLVRSLYDRYQQERESFILGQIANLRRRIVIIRVMQLLGTLSFFFCVGTMGVLFIGNLLVAEIIFAFSLLLLLSSLGCSIWELWISADALDLQLKNIDKQK